MGLYGIPFIRSLVSASAPHKSTMILKYHNSSSYIPSYKTKTLAEDTVQRMRLGRVELTVQAVGFIEFRL